MRCKYLVAILLTFSLVGSGCSGGGPEVVVDGVYTGPKDVAAPSISIDSIGRVRAARGETEMFAGTSFLLEHADGTLMVGANHILKGVNLDLESKGIEVGLRSKRKNLAIPFLKRVPIENQGDATYSSPPETSRAQGDLAVLFVKDLNKGAKPMKLGTVDVKKGEPVWIAELQGPMSAPTGVDLVPGVVDYHSSKVLTVKMHRKTSVGETSGAPILNAQGEVVGVNVGVSYSDAGDFRIAVPGASVRALKNLQTPSGVPRTPR